MTETDHKCIDALSQLFPELSPAEKEISILLSGGLTPKEIATYRNSDIEVIKKTISHSRRKLDCKTQNELRTVINIRIMAKDLFINCLLNQ